MAGRWSFPLVLVLALVGCSRDRMGMTAKYAEGPVSQQAPAIVSTVVDYDTADIVRFVDETRVLVGSLRVDGFGGPTAYGPLHLYDAPTGRQLWQAKRDKNPELTHEILAVAPLIVTRANAVKKSVYRAIDPATGEQRWTKSVRAKCRTAHETGPQGLASIYVLCRDNLERIDAETGDTTWKAKASDANEAPCLVPDASGIVVVGRTQMTSLSKAGGAPRWTGATPTSRTAVACDAGPAGLLTYDATAVAMVDAGTGKARWTREIPGGGVKLAAEDGGAVFVVAHIDGADRLSVIINGEIAATQPVGGVVHSGLAFDDGSVYLTTASHAVSFGRDGLTAGMSVELPFKWKGHLDPLPDALALRGGNLVVAREGTNVVAVDIGTGEVAWQQRTQQAAVMSILALEAIGDLLPDAKKAFEPGGPQSFTGGQPNSRFAVAQAAADHHAARARRILDDPNASAADRQSAQATLNLSARQGIASERMRARAGRTAATAEMATSMMAAASALGDAVSKALEEKAKRARFLNARVALQLASAGHVGSLDRKYWVHVWGLGSPPTYGATFVEPDTGRRMDLFVSLKAGGVPTVLPVAGVSPDGRYIVAVGVGLDPSEHQPQKRFMATVPKASLNVYDITRYAFTDEQRTGAVDPKAIAKVFLDQGWPIVPAYVMANLLQPLEEALEGGEDVNAPIPASGATGLYLAATQGNLAMVELLLAHGADKTIRDKQGKTAMDVLREMPDLPNRDATLKLLQ